MNPKPFRVLQKAVNENQSESVAPWIRTRKQNGTWTLLGESGGLSKQILSRIGVMILISPTSLPLAQIPKISNFVAEFISPKVNTFSSMGCNMIPIDLFQKVYGVLLQLLSQTHPEARKNPKPQALHPDTPKP